MLTNRQSDVYKMIRANMSKKRGRDPDSLIDLAARKVLKLGAVDTLRQMVDWTVLTMDKLLKELLLLFGYPTMRIRYRRRTNVSWRRVRWGWAPRALYRDGSVGDGRTINIQPWGPHELPTNFHRVPQTWYRGGRLVMSLRPNLDDDD
jgi:hypothetical protein